MKNYNRLLSTLKMHPKNFIKSIIVCFAFINFASCDESSNKKNGPSANNLSEKNL